MRLFVSVTCWGRMDVSAGALCVLWAPFFKSGRCSFEIGPVRVLLRIAVNRLVYDVGVLSDQWVGSLVEVFPGFDVRLSASVDRLDHLGVFAGTCSVRWEPFPISKQCSLTSGLFCLRLGKAVYGLDHASFRFRPMPSRCDRRKGSLCMFCDRGPPCDSFYSLLRSLCRLWGRDSL